MEMDDGARLWLFKHAKKNFWRVPAYYTMTDLIQDGYMVYYRTLDIYAGVKDRPGIMALFRTSFLNHIHNLSKKKRKSVPEVKLTPDMLSLAVDHGCEGVSTLVSSMPLPVRRFIQALDTEQGRKKLCKKYRVGKRGRQTTNERWCRVARVPTHKYNLPVLVRAAIKGVENGNKHNKKVPLRGSALAPTGAREP